MLLIAVLVIWRLLCRSKRKVNPVFPAQPTGMHFGEDGHVNGAFELSNMPKKL